MGALPRALLPCWFWERSVWYPEAGLWRILPEWAWKEIFLALPKTTWVNLDTYLLRAENLVSGLGISSSQLTLDTTAVLAATLIEALWELLRYKYSAKHSPGDSDSKESAYNAGSIPGLGRSLGEGNISPLQHSCLENPMDWGTWWATVHGVLKSQTWLSD